MKNKMLKLIIRYCKEKNKYSELLENENLKKLPQEKKVFTYTFPLKIQMSGNCNLYFMEFEKYLFELYKKDIIELFETFLKEKNALKPFFNYVNSAFIIKQIGLKNFIKCDTRKELVYENLTPTGFVMYAFKWDNTMKGHNFWMNINDAWENKIRKYYDTI